MKSIDSVIKVRMMIAMSGLGVISIQRCQILMYF